MHEHPNIATEFADGERLDSKLARDGRLPVFQGWALAAQLLSALGHAHREGVVHGALGLDQLVVRRCGQLQVIGFAFEGPRAEDRGVTPCTAPEQILGQPANQRSDLYAAAVIAYELLTGALPFARWPTRAARPGLPAGVDRVFQRALAQDPRLRHASAAELLADLQQAIGTPAWVRPPAPAARPAPTRHVRRWAAWATACAAAAGLAAGWTGLELAHDPPARRVQTEMAAAALAPPAREAAPARPDPVVLAASPLAAPPVRPELKPEPEPPVEPELPAPAPPPTRAHAAPTHHQLQRRVAAVHQHATDPAAALRCRKASAFARELCAAFRCATAEYRHHPVCVRMHAEAFARNRLAEPRDGP